MRMKNHKGFSLIELLIIVAIISVIAALAVPNLLARRRAANEARAQSSLRTIHFAQATYQATFGNGSFAPDLATLSSESLIDSQLGSGSEDGYNFAIFDVAGVGITAVFGASAYPTKASGILQTGTRRFGLTEVGRIRGDSDLTTEPRSRAVVNSMELMP